MYLNYFSIKAPNQSQIQYRIYMSEQKPQDLENKYSDLLSKYRKVLWTSITSMVALAGTVVYSKYQIFRKQKIIDEKDNQIKNQKEQLHHLQNEAKELNRQLAEEFKVILKNLKQNVTNDPNVKGISNSLKSQINHTFEEINTALRKKLDYLKQYNYKESMEKWYLNNLVSNEGFKFNSLRKIELVEADWKHHKDSIKDGYTWRQDGQHSLYGIAESGEKEKKQFQKMKAYFERKNSYEGKGVEIKANAENLGDSFFGSSKVLQVKYRCWAFDITTGQFTIPLYLIKPNKDQSTDVKVETIEEGKESYIDCRDNEWTKRQ